MSIAIVNAGPPPRQAGRLSKESSLAGPGFNRWLAPTCALAIHLCIGMAYSFSVFWLPMSQLLQVSDPTLCTDTGLWGQLLTTQCNWTIPAVSLTFTLFIVMLGVSAATFGAWLEHAGPRKAGLIAALCWGGGMALGGLGVATHQLWLLWLGCGVLGGIGQGLGYITPVSTLIKWFPDRRGMATGFAIMGYGGGAMIGAPVAVALMTHFSVDGRPGVAPTMALMGAAYFLIMSLAALGFRTAPVGWLPRGYVRPAVGRAMITRGHVHVQQAWKTPQFLLLWIVLCMNVTAGIGILEQAFEFFVASQLDLKSRKHGGHSASFARNPIERKSFNHEEHEKHEKMQSRRAGWRKPPDSLPPENLPAM